MKICMACGKIVTGQFTNKLCQTHYNQMKRTGFIYTNKYGGSLIDIYGDIAKIHLRDRHHVLIGYALIDISNVNEVKSVRWRLLKGYVVGCFSDDRNKPLHRFLMSTPKGLTCDHINMNKFDNREVNLRNCTLTENNYNKDVKNYSWNKYHKKWCVEVLGKFIGYYEIEEDAKRNAVEVSIKMKGKFSPHYNKEEL